MLVQIIDMCKQGPKLEVILTGCSDDICTGYCFVLCCFSCHIWKWCVSLRSIKKWDCWQQETDIEISGLAVMMMVRFQGYTMLALYFVYIILIIPQKSNRNVASREGVIDFSPPGLNIGSWHRYVVIAKYQLLIIVCRLDFSFWRLCIPWKETK